MLIKMIFICQAELFPMMDENPKSYTLKKKDEHLNDKKKA